MFGSKLSDHLAFDLISEFLFLLIKKQKNSKLISQLFLNKSNGHLAALVRC